jgi:hypothetical protein
MAALPALRADSNSDQPLGELYREGELSIRALATFHAALVENIDTLVTLTSYRFIPRACRSWSCNVRELFFAKEDIGPVCCTEDEETRHSSCLLGPPLQKSLMA